MNAVDATERGGKLNDHDDVAAPPSLLTVILDTNPHAWALLADTLPLSKAVANLLVFINAHLAINNANRVAVIASHVERAEWLYPTPSPPTGRDGTSDRDSDGDVGMADDGASTQPPDDPHKYRPFAHIEHALTTNLRGLMSTTSEASLTSTPATMLAGALTMALAYTSKLTACAPPTSAQNFNYSDPSSVAGGNDLTDPASADQSSNPQTLRPRVLILSVSGDLAAQYIPIMNAIFASARLQTPIDILKVAGSDVLLHQAAVTTAGTYLQLTPPTPSSLLQHLLFAFLPDTTARRHLIAPSPSTSLDFRAACFCHRRVVDLGFVCGICLSIFCAPLDDGVCLTCGTQLTVADHGRKPAVLPKKKSGKKKKRLVDGAAEASASSGATPVSS